MARSVASLAIEVTGNIAGFVSDMGRAQREADKAARQMERDFKRMGAQIGIAAVAGFAALTAGAKKAINEMDRIGDVSARIGVSTEALSALGYAAKQTGTDAGALEAGLTKLSRTMAEAAAGNAQQKQLFDQLGVAITDSTGKLRSADAVFIDIAARFKTYKNGAGEVALAQALMGRSASTLIPLLNEGKEGIGALTDEAERFGVVLGTDTVAAAQEFNDNFDKLKAITQGVFNDIAKQLLPSLVELSALLVDNSAKTREQADGFSVLSESIKVTVAGATLLKNTIESLVDLIATSVNTVRELDGTLRNLAGTMTQGFGANLKFLTGDFAGGSRAIGDLLGGAVDQSGESFGRIGAGWEAFFSGLQNGSQDTADVLTSLWATLTGTGEQAKKTGEDVGGVEPPVAALGTAAAKTDKAMKSAKAALADYVRASESLEQRIDSAAAALGDDFVRAAMDFKRALVEIQREEADLMQAGPLSPEDIRRLAQARDLETKSYQRQTAEIRKQQTFVEQLIDDLEFELRISKLSNEEREREIALRVAGADATKEQRDRIIELITQQQLQDQATESATTLTFGLTDAFTTFAGALGEGQNAFEALRSVGMSSINDLIGEFGKLLESTRNAETGALDFGKAFQKIIEGFKTGDGQGVLGALGNIAGAFAQGSGGGARGAIAGALSGALSGFQAGGYYGAIIGAVLGAISGYGSEQEPKLSVATGTGSLGTEASLTGPFGRINVGDRDLSSTPMQTAQAIQDFDRQVALMLDSVQEGLAATALRAFNFRGEGGEATVGEALEARLEAIARGVFEAPVADFLRTFSNDLQQQMQVFGDLLALDKIVKRGEGLFDNLPAIVESIRQFQQAGETVAQTYTRIVQSFELYEEAMALHGEAINAMLPGVVAFATQIAEAAGGVEAASRLWNTYFDTFFSAEERARINLQQAETDLVKEAADIGLDPTISREEFRQQFMDVLPSLTPEEVVQWLQFASAIAAVEEAEQALTDARIEAGEAANAAAEAELERVMALAAFMGDVSFERYLLTLTEQEREIARINRETEEMIAQAVELGASEEQLAEIRALGEDRINALTEAEEVHGEAVVTLTSTLVEAGTTLESIMARVFAVLGQTGSIEDKLEAMGRGWHFLWKQAAELGADANQLNLIRQAGAVEMRNLVEQEIAAVESQIAQARQVADGIRQWLDSQPFGTSSANPMGQFAEAQRQWDEALGLARGGSTDAIRGLTRDADQLIREAAEFWGVGSEQFRAIEASIRDSLEPFTEANVDEALLDELAHLNDVLANLELFLLRFLGPITLPPPPVVAPPGTTSANASTFDTRELVSEVRALRMEVRESATKQANAIEFAAAKADRRRSAY